MVGQETQSKDTILPSSDRCIGVLKGAKSGPTLIFTAGIHGNEPSGVIALQKVFSSLSDSTEKFKGSAYAFKGNLRALEVGQRFIETDLNRLWYEEQIEKIEKNQLNGSAQIPDVQEQIALFSEIKHVLKNEQGPFMFFDLHTTSAASVPFILINDTLNNRSLAEKYPLRVILGIEEYLRGPMLSYINDQGYISLGFEAGQHDDPNSIKIHEVFILQSFMLAGFMKDKAMYQDLIRSRKSLPYAHTFFEVRHRYSIKEHEEFRMIEGYNNFSKIIKGQLLANNEKGEINSIEGGYLFMPLYQRKGSEGFYIIKLIPKFWLVFSSIIRSMNFDYLLLALPGVKRYDDKYKTLEVNVRIARFLSRDLFHLLGYRRMKRSGFKLIYVKRERTKREFNKP